MTGTHISARVEHKTLDEFEAGFCDRIGDGSVFLSRAHIVSPAQDLIVGSAVHLEVQLPTGTRALVLDGVVAWSYPVDRVPPGREAGTGILIDSLEETTSARVDRMRRRPGAGSRVRAPGTRLPPLKLDAPKANPRPFSTLLAATLAHPPPPAPAPAPVSVPSGAPATFQATPNTLPPAPAPRLMGLLVDQTFDPTPAPGPRPITLDSIPPHPFARQVPPAAALRREEGSGPVPLAQALSPNPPPNVDIASLPDAPPIAGAFEQGQTDVDLLVSLSDGDFFPAELEDQRRGPAADMPMPFAIPRSSPSNQMFAQLDDLPSAEADLVAETVDSLPGIPPAGDRSLDTSEHTLFDAALPQSKNDWDLRTEAGQLAVDSSTAEATTSEGERSAISGPTRALPAPAPWPPLMPMSTEPMGVAFLVSFRRPREPIAAVEIFTWPRSGTKRMGSLDVAREEGGEAAVEAALESSPWLYRDASAPPDSDDAMPAPNPLEEETLDAFERNMTDPGMSVSDVVDRAVALAESDADSVFADSPAPAAVRPAMKKGDLMADDTNGETTSDELHAPKPGFIEDDPDTERDLQRPNQERLGVLKKFLRR